MVRLLNELGEAVQAYLTWDEQESSSIYSSLHWARENARTIRETMSVEMWESINDLWLWLRDRSAQRHHALGESPGERETTVDAAQWLAILRSCSGFEPCFKRSAHGIHTTLTWIVDTNAELCSAIHRDYLDPPVEALRHGVRAAVNPSFRPLEQSQLQG